MNALAYLLIYAALLVVVLAGAVGVVVLTESDIEVHPIRMFRYWWKKARSIDWWHLPSQIRKRREKKARELANKQAEDAVRRWNAIKMERNAQAHADWMYQYRDLMLEVEQTKKPAPLRLPRTEKHTVRHRVTTIRSADGEVVAEMCLDCSQEKRW